MTLTPEQSHDDDPAFDVSEYTLAEGVDDGLIEAFANLDVLSPYREDDEIPASQDNPDDDTFGELFTADPDGGLGPLGAATGNSVRGPNQAAAMAVSYARANRYVTPSMCLAYTRGWYGVASRYPSAISAWLNNPDKRYTSNPHAVPRGVPVWWTGGTYGHIAISLGNGLCASTDWPRAQVGICGINQLSASWGKRFVGWSPSINGVQVWQPEPDVNEEWAGGAVYVEKLHVGQKNSDSVKRLKWRLRHHADIPHRLTKPIVVNGDYGSGTADAVKWWQRNVAEHDPEHDNGVALSNRQANRLFGDNFRVIEAAPQRGGAHGKGDKR
jgi:hypothetical protein